MTLALLLAILATGSGMAADIITPHIPYFHNQTKPFIIRDVTAWNSGAAAVDVSLVSLATNQTIWNGQAVRIASSDFGGGCFYGNLEFAAIPKGSYRIVYGGQQKTIVIGDNAAVTEAVLNFFVRQKRNSSDGHLGVVHADAGIASGLPANLKNGFNDATDVRAYSFSTALAVISLAKSGLYLNGDSISQVHPVFGATSTRSLVAHGIDFLLKLQGPYQNGGRDLFWGLTNNNYLTDNVPSTDDPAATGSITNTRRGLGVLGLALGAIILDMSPSATDRALAAQARAAAGAVYAYNGAGASAWGNVEVRGTLGWGNLALWLLDGFSTSSIYRQRSLDRLADVVARQVPGSSTSSLYGWFTAEPGQTTGYFPRYGSALDHLILTALITNAVEPGSAGAVSARNAVTSFFEGYLLRFMPWRGGNAFGRPAEIIYRNGTGAPSGLPTYPGTADRYDHWSPTAAGASRDNQFLTAVAAACGPASELVGGNLGAEIRRAGVHVLYHIFGMNSANRRSVDCPSSFLVSPDLPQIPHYTGGIGNLPGGVPAPMDFAAIQNGFGANFTYSGSWEWAEWHLEKQSKMLEALAYYLRLE